MLSFIHVFAVETVVRILLPIKPVVNSLLIGPQRGNVTLQGSSPRRTETKSSESDNSSLSTCSDVTVTDSSKPTESANNMEEEPVENTQEDEVECKSCALLKEQNGILKNKILTRQGHLKSRKAENRKCIRKGKYWQ